jgi:DNA-binding response OmpR family regulator
MVKVLVVEDDLAILNGLAESLAFEGYEVFTAQDGKAGYEACSSHKPDLILLDVMLPRVSGLELCRRIREEGLDTAVVMLTARGEEADRIIGLDLGADDYVTKPFSLPELNDSDIRRTSWDHRNRPRHLRFPSCSPQDV